MAQLVHTHGDSTVIPKGNVQFGNKFFVCLEDSRPMYMQFSGRDGSAKMYPCGIQPPTLPVDLWTSTVAAVNLVNAKFTTDGSIVQLPLYFAYMYYSSRRNVFSRLSPVRTSILVPSGSPNKKIRVGKNTVGSP